MRLGRRGVLAGAALGGGLLVAWSLLPRSYDSPLAPGDGEVAFDAWLKIARDGVVTVAVPQLEMGQGVTTLLPQVVAMELGADWRQVAVEPAPSSGAYANLPLAARWAPLWRPLLPALADGPDDLLVRRFAEEGAFAATADGLSLAAYEASCRAAGASARALLAMAAAEEWGIAWEECIAESGFITHGDKRLSFGELALAAAEFTPPDPPPLLPGAPAEAPAPGGTESELAFPRIDLPAKVDGSLQFAGDIRLPEMVHAAIRHGPIDEAELTHFDVEAVAGMRDLVGIVRGKRWLVVAANNWWAAERALDAMAPQFRLRGPVESGRIGEKLDDAIRTQAGIRIAERGSGREGMETPTLALRYDVAPALHATLETASATARFDAGRLELWLASQAPEAARRAAARALGIAESEAILYPVPAGGSFDARLEKDHAVEAALIAREIGRPVQLTWSRWQEHLAGRPRTPVSALLSAKYAVDGTISHWRAKLALPSTSHEFGRRLFANATSWSAMEDAAGRADPLACEGAVPPYGIPNVALDHVPVEIGLPTGRLRGNAHGYTAFFTECFLDEIAHRTRREPLSFRIQMLGEDIRLAACLQQAARLGNWDGGVDQSGQGLACHRIGEGRIALVATAVQGEGGVRVEKLSAAVDIGRIVNLDIARQQVEGGLLYGMALALGSSSDYARGLPTATRLADLALPVLADCPEVEVEFIASDADPADPGELGVAVAAPAIANALFSATGLRLRRLPLLSGGL